jgi:predicted ABC-type ATPase
MDLLTEGVYDKGIFKAIFMAGGPGSGKTFVAQNLFGIPKNATTSVSGLKTVNSDKQFMHLLTKYNFDPTELAQYPDEVFNRELSDSPEKGGAGLRDFAQTLKTVEKQGFLDGKLGMIIDSTGSNFQKVKRQKEELEKAGYDCYMVFVMTKLDTALERNKKRAEEGERELPANIVKKSWTDTRKNMGGLKALFGKNFALVNNDKKLAKEETYGFFRKLVKSTANKWTNNKIQNPKGKQWVKDMLRLKKVGLTK